MNLKKDVKAHLMGLERKKFQVYGERLSIVFHQITRSLLKSETEFDFEIKVLSRDRQYLASSGVGVFPLHAIYMKPDFIDREIEEKPVFDSSIEEKFFKLFEKKPDGWTVVYEPEPIIVPETGTLFIPDFALIRGNIKIYVEIIGFWTESYKKKKKAKLKILQKYTSPPIKLILLIDEKYKDFFKEDFGFPTIFYSSKGIKSKDVLNILEQRFSDFEGRLNAIVNRRNDIAKKIESTIAHKNYLSIKELYELLELYTIEELHKCLEIPEIAHILSMNEFRYIPHLLCVKKTTLIEFKESLVSIIEEKGGKVQLNFLESWMSQTYGFPVKLTAMLDYFGGFEINWRSIHNPTVRPK